MRKRTLPFLVATSLATIITSAPVWAQDDPDDQDANEAGALEEVVITGSRIRQNPLEVRTPVQFISEADMDATSTLSVGDYLQKLPIAGSSINRLNNSSGNLGFPPDGSGIGAGASEIDLRYLSSKRTLVLVDGRRWVRGSSASGVSGAVDLNTIPSNAIKTIEILQDGASAVYGSDAIGGVVNIITKDDYDGLKATAYYGQYEQGDGESMEADVSWGSQGERSRSFFNISWTDQENVGAGDRFISEFPIVGQPIGISSGTPEGRLVFTDPRIGQTLSITSYVVNPTYDPNCWATGTSVPGCDDFQPFTLADRFNYQPFNFLQTPNRRVNLFAKSEFDISDTTTARVLAMFNNRESTSRAAPEPLFFGPDAGAGFILDNLVWPADHPTNPFGITLGPDNFVFTGRRPIEAGPRIFDQSVDTWYISAGLDGQFNTGSSSIYWDATAIWSENKAEQQKQGAFNAQNIAIALGPTEICDATPGCVPFNWVGPGAMTQEMLDFLTFIQKDISNQDLFSFSFNVTGEFGGFEAGPIGWAAGYERREENGYFIPDSIVSKGFTAGVPASPTAGGFEVDEIYAEVIVPLWRGNNNSLFDLSVAVRSSDYDLFSSETISDFGLTFAPNEQVVFRASFSEGFRAPHIGELFNTGSRFDAGINDPCSNAAAADEANCLALGVPAGFISPNPQTSVTTGGNPNLTPETADTFTAGFTWDVAAADNWDGVESLLFEANYYDIDIDNAVQPPDAQDLLDQCVDTLNPFFCDNITRTANGTVTRIAGVLQNIGGIETSGYDWKLELTTAPRDYGQFRFQWMNTHLSDYIEKTQGPDGIISVDRAGTELGSPERGFVENKSTLNVDWMKDDWSARLTLRHIDSLTEQCGGLLPDFELTNLCTNDPDTNELGSSLWTDFQVSWAPEGGGDNNWTFTFGVDNVFDEDIPICYSCDLNSFDGTLYPIPGQFWYLRTTFEID